MEEIMSILLTLLDSILPDLLFCSYLLYASGDTTSKARRKCIVSQPSTDNVTLSFAQFQL